MARSRTCTMLLALPLLLFPGPVCQISPSDSPSDSLEDLLARPRPSLSSATRRTAEDLAQELRSLGLEVSFEETEIDVPLPRQGRLVVQDDLGGEHHRRAFAWDPEAVPVAAWPTVGVGPSAVHGKASGAIVNVEDGSPEDLARLAEARVELTGTVALCRQAGSDASEQIARLAEAGCVGVLLAPPADEVRARSASLASESTLVPTFCIHRREAEFLRSGLLVKRMTGADGKRRPFATGPGPLRAEVEIKSETRSCRSTSIIARKPGASVLRELHAAALDGDAAPILALMEFAGEALDAGAAVAFFDGGRYGAAGARGYVEQHATELAELERYIELVARGPMLREGQANPVPASAGAFPPNIRQILVIDSGGSTGPAKEKPPEGTGG